MRRAALLAGFVALAPALAAQAPAAGYTVIRVHFLGAKNGKPQRDQRVMLTDLPRRLPPGGKPLVLVRRTGRDGVAVFRLRDPPPARLLVIGGLDSFAWHACSRPFFCTAQIVRRGVAAEDICWKALNHAKRPAPIITPKPGEVYTYARYINRLEWGLDEALPPFFRRSGAKLRQQQPTEPGRCPPAPRGPTAPPPVNPHGAARDSGLGASVPPPRPSPGRARRLAEITRSPLAPHPSERAAHPGSRSRRDAGRGGWPITVPGPRNWAQPVAAGRWPGLGSASTETRHRHSGADA